MYSMNKQTIKRVKEISYTTSLNSPASYNTIAIKHTANTFRVYEDLTDHTYICSIGELRDDIMNPGYGCEVKINYIVWNE